MSENLQPMDWYQVDATGAILLCGRCQSVHIGDVQVAAGLTLRMGKAHPLVNYESAPGVIATYTPAQAALRNAPIPAAKWSAQAMHWVKG